MLAIDGLAVAVGGAPLLEGIDLRLAAGETVAVLGPSGVDKTSFLRVVAGLSEGAGGTATLDGEPPERLGYPRWRRRVLYVAQRPALGAGTIRAALARPFALRVAEAPFDEGEALRLLDLLEVGAGRLDDPVEILSVGEQQRVALARALLVAPRVLLLDEPTSALDELRRARVEEAVRAHRETGGASLWVTHDRAQADRVADRSLDLGEHAVRG